LSLPLLVLLGCGGSGAATGFCPTPLPEPPPAATVVVPRGLELRLKPRKVEALFIASQSPGAVVSRVAAYRSFPAMHGRERVGPELADDSDRGQPKLGGLLGRRKAN